MLWTATALPASTLIKDDVFILGVPAQMSVPLAPPAAKPAAAPAPAATPAVNPAPAAAPTLNLAPTGSQGTIEQLQGGLFGFGPSTTEALPAHQKFSKEFIELLANVHFTLTDKVKREAWTKKWVEQIGTIKDYKEADTFNRKVMKSLDQRFDYYLDVDETKDSGKKTDPTFVGIGSRIELKGSEEITDSFPEKIKREDADKLLVVTPEHPIALGPFPDSPAAKAGVLKGDILLKVDGKDLTGMTTEEVVKLIKGKEDTKVDLTVARKDATGKISPLDKSITVIRGKWTAPVVETRALPNNVSYIKLEHFMADKAAEEMLSALTAAGKVKDGKIILDLRGNGGGRLDHAINIVSYMLAEGSIVTLQKRRGDDMVNQRTYTTLDSTLTTQPVDFNRGISVQAQPKVLVVPVDMPIVILIDDGSASASEIVSGALSFNKRAVIVGETSHGKGVGQDVLELEGRSIRVTSFFFLPAGRETDFEGIHPDRVVSLEKEIKRIIALRKELRDALAKVPAAKADPAAAAVLAEVEAKIAACRAELKSLRTMLQENDPQLKAAQEEAEKELVRIRSEAAERKKVRDEAVKKKQEAWDAELKKRALAKPGDPDEEE